MGMLYYSLVCLSVIIHLKFAQALSLDALRRSLNVDPVTSHRRDVIVPQNFNIPITDIRTNTFPNRAVAADVQASLPQPIAITAPNKADGVIQTQIGDINKPTDVGQSIINDEAARSRAQQQHAAQTDQQPPLPPVLLPETSNVPRQTLQTVPQIEQKPFPQPDVPRPSFTPVRIGRRPVKYRLLKDAGTIVTATPALKCSFQIPPVFVPRNDATQLNLTSRCPHFLLPRPSKGPNPFNVRAQLWTGVARDSANHFNDIISHLDLAKLEQNCLLPAMRAYKNGGQICRTRELHLYLKFLLYLRECLFNI